MDILEERGISTFILEDYSRCENILILWFKFRSNGRVNFNVY